MKDDCIWGWVRVVYGDGIDHCYNTLSGTYSTCPHASGRVEKAIELMAFLAPCYKLFGPRFFFFEGN